MKSEPPVLQLLSQPLNGVMCMTESAPTHAHVNQKGLQREGGGSLSALFRDSDFPQPPFPGEIPRARSLLHVNSSDTAALRHPLMSARARDGAARGAGPQDEDGNIICLQGGACQPGHFPNRTRPTCMPSQSSDQMKCLARR